MDDEDFIGVLKNAFKAPGTPFRSNDGVQAVREILSKPVSIDIDKLFADEEPVKAEQRPLPSRVTDKKRAQEFEQLSSDVAELSRMVGEKHRKLSEEVRGHKSKVEIRIDAKETRVIKEELARLFELYKELGKYEYGSTLNVLGNGTAVGFTGAINFKNGTGTTVTTSLNRQGYVDVEIDLTGGFSTLSSTETPNDIIQVFTFAAATAKPSFIVSDGAMMRATAKDGTVNWTWSNPLKQATMTIPPSDDIVAIV